MRPRPPPRRPPSTPTRRWNIRACRRRQRPGRFARAAGSDFPEPLRLMNTRPWRHLLPPPDPATYIARTEGPATYGAGRRRSGTAWLPVSRRPESSSACKARAQAEKIMDLGMGAMKPTHDLGKGGAFTVTRCRGRLGDRSKHGDHDRLCLSPVTGSASDDRAARRCSPPPSSSPRRPVPPPAPARAGDARLLQGGLRAHRRRRGDEDGRGRLGLEGDGGGRRAAGRPARQDGPRSDRSGRQGPPAPPSAARSAGATSS